METNTLFFDDVLGLSFSISAEENSAYLESLLNRYRIILENTKQAAKINDKEPLKLAILTGFLLCDEIEKMKNQQKQEGDKAEQLMLDLIARIDEAIPNE